MEHPLKEKRESQKKFLSELPKDQREEHARLFRIGNATYRYHQLADRQEPSEDDFREWLEGLADNIRKGMKERGLENCKTAFPFTRYVNEKNDIGMDQWMKENLSAEDYKAYREPGTSL